MYRHSYLKENIQWNVPLMIGSYSYHFAKTQLSHYRFASMLYSLTKSHYNIQILEQNNACKWLNRNPVPSHCRMREGDSHGAGTQFVCSGGGRLRPDKDGPQSGRYTTVQTEQWPDTQKVRTWSCEGWVSGSKTWKRHTVCWSPKNIFRDRILK